jgi:zinc transporter 1/2/3
MFLNYYNHKLQKEEEEHKTGNLILKISSIVIFLIMATGFGVMPYFITKCRTSTKFLSISNAFSGGLFLGIGLFHVLPEGAEMLEELSDAPIAYFCAFLSYALILFVEKVAFNGHALLHGHDDHKDKKEERITLSKLNETERTTENNDEKNEEENENEDINEKKEPMIQLDLKNQENIKEDESPENKKNEHNEEEHKHEHEDDNEHHHEHKASGITPYILLLALGFHGFFEGMALGIQSDIKDTLSLFLAIAAHKWAASLTLGISFVKAEVEKKQLIIMVLIFAFIGPVGIAFGLILSETANDNLQGIFLSISVGTFLYIACSEVLVEEFENPNHKYLKFGMFMLGGIFIAGLALLELVMDVEE